MNNTSAVKASGTEYKKSVYKTLIAKPADVERQWVLIDATGLVLGRLASVIAHRLRGKHKPNYAPHMDVGDFIVVVNADKIKVTGDKTLGKLYYRHTGYPSGLRIRTLGKMLNSTKPNEVIEVLEKAVKGMLPNNPLGRDMFRKLKVYVGPEHPHASQQPEVLVASDLL